MTDHRARLLQLVRASGDPPAGFGWWLEYAPNSFPALWDALPDGEWVIETMRLAGVPASMLEQADRRARAAVAEAELKAGRGERVARALLAAEAARSVCSAQTVMELLVPRKWRQADEG